VLLTEWSGKPAVENQEKVPKAEEFIRIKQVAIEVQACNSGSWLSDLDSWHISFLS
jgi:hypothetical protein